MGIGQHLDLDVARLLDELLDIERVVTKARLRLRARASACSSCFSSRTSRMPLPPPPALAFTITGSPISMANAVACSSVSASMVPGTIGTPAFCIVRRAVTLSPIERITSPVGPMKRMPAALHASAKSPFSARKP
jgi:hypothetical protein